MRRTSDGDVDSHGSCRHWVPLYGVSASLKLAFPHLTQSKALTQRDVVVWCVETHRSCIHFIQLAVLSQNLQRGIRWPSLRRSTETSRSEPVASCLEASSSRNWVSHGNLFLSLALVGEPALGVPVVRGMVGHDVPWLSIVCILYSVCLDDK